MPDPAPPEPAIEYQSTSLDIWANKYRLHDADARPLEADMHATYERVARALADAEPSDKLARTWFPRFLRALNAGATPAGRIMANVGAREHKPATSTINCTVSGTIDDSMDAILTRLHEAGMTLKAGCGIGYDFSTLRPKGAHVAGAGAYTSGPLSFMDVYDTMCTTISSAGGRRGAQMATFDISHPDVFDFIEAKRSDARLRHFNCSLLVTSDFLDALEHDGQWPLSFPFSQERYPGPDEAEVHWRPWPYQDPRHVRNEAGLVACRVYRRVPARALWERIMRSTYEFSDPGFVLVDRINEMNNNWFCETIRATNPCGEQPLPPHGSCLLGSINLARFVLDPFTERARFDRDAYNETVEVFTRMLDNVVELNELPLRAQREEILSKRRHGMGFYGLGSALALLRIPYPAPEAVAFTEQVSRDMALTGWRAALALAEEKGPAPIMDETFEVTPAMLAARPALAQDGHRAGARLPGKTLHARYSAYMRRVAAAEPDLVEALATTGARFTHHSSIAPTGTIALSFGNNASNGIEPSFLHRYLRNVIREDRPTKEQVEVFSYEFLAYRTLVDPKAEAQGPLPEYFCSADTVAPKRHIDIQAAAQNWVDSSISKTINVAAGCPYEEFQDLYRYAVAKGLKGCTTFRFNPSAFQGVLVKQSDLAATRYVFTLDDGTEVEAAGDEEIEYDGYLHSAANLFDALKERTYSKP